MNLDESVWNGELIREDGAVVLMIFTWSPLVFIVSPAIRFTPPATGPVGAMVVWLTTNLQQCVTDRKLLNREG